MAKRVKFIYEHGTSVDFVTRRAMAVEDVSRRLRDAAIGAGASADVPDPHPYVCFVDALGNAISINSQRVLAVIIENLTDDEEELLAERLAELRGVSEDGDEATDEDGIR